MIMIVLYFKVKLLFDVFTLYVMYHVIYQVSRLLLCGRFKTLLMLEFKFQFGLFNF